MQLAMVLILGRGRTDHGPDLLLAVVPTHQHAHQLDGVEAVGFGSALAAIDLDTRRIDDEVLDAVSPEEAIEPEAVASGFVTGDNLGVLGKPEACLGGLDLGQEQIQGAGRDGSQSWFLCRADRESQFPGVPAQLQGEVEHRGCRECRILVVGRRHGKAP